MREWPRQTRCVRSSQLGLPWWLSGKESTCQCGRHRFYPSSGKIPHAEEQLSPCATTVEPTWHSYWTPRALEPALHSRSHHKQGLLFIVVHGLLVTVASHCIALALGSQVSVIVAHGPSCSAACQRLSPCPLHGRQILNHATFKEAPIYLFF